MFLFYLYLIVILFLDII